MCHAQSDIFRLEFYIVRGNGFHRWGFDMGKLIQGFFRKEKVIDWPEGLPMFRMLTTWNYLNLAFSLALIAAAFAAMMTGVPYLAEQWGGESARMHAIHILDCLQVGILVFLFMKLRQMPKAMSVKDYVDKYNDSVEWREEFVDK
jgi:hypothetical protein